MSRLRILCVYYSLSGNTMKTMQVAAKFLQETGHDVHLHLIDPGKNDQAPRIEDYDLAFIGSYTEDYGSVPPEVKDYVGYNRRSNHPVAVLGTGDELWGEEYYCGAVDRLARYYQSPFEVYKAEHYPADPTQVLQIQLWAETVVSKAYQLVPRSFTQQLLQGMVNQQTTENNSTTSGRGE